MYHFNFKVSDEDALNIMQAVYHKACEQNERAVFLKMDLAKGTQTVEEKRVIESEINICEGQAKYMKGLLDKMEYNRTEQGDE